MVNANRKAIAFACAAALSACQQQAPVEVSEVLNHSVCQKLRTGLTVVEEARLATIRGTQMLNDLPASQPADPAGPQDLLIAVSNGSPPTPGYAFKLEAASAEGNEIVLDYQWITPAADAVLAQMVTSPCSVVRIANAGRANAVSARLDGREIGRVSLNAEADAGS